MKIVFFVSILSLALPVFADAYIILEESICEHGSKPHSEKPKPRPKR